MSVKYFNKQTQKWEIFPGTAGISAYESAQKGGYVGTEEEFNGQIANFETILRKEVEITSNADDVHYPSSKAVKDYVANNVVHIEIADNLTTESAGKALSANQGKILNDNKLDKSTYNADKSSFAIKEEIPDISNLATKNELDSKASSTHNHTTNDITDLQTIIDKVTLPLTVLSLTNVSTSEMILTAFGGEERFNSFLDAIVDGNSIVISGSNEDDSQVKYVTLNNIVLTSSSEVQYTYVDNDKVFQNTISLNGTTPQNITVKYSSFIWDSDSE